MSGGAHAWGLLRKLEWEDLLLALAILILARLLILAVGGMIRYSAEKAPRRLRLRILRAAPIARVLIEIGSIVVILPILVEPTFQNTVALVATAGSLWHLHSRITRAALSRGW